MRFARQALRRHGGGHAEADKGRGCGQHVGTDHCFLSDGHWSRPKIGRDLIIRSISSGRWVFPITRLTTRIDKVAAARQRLWLQRRGTVVASRRLVRYRFEKSRGAKA
jgi:hypothetical protein